MTISEALSDECRVTFKADYFASFLVKDRTAVLSIIDIQADVD
jgi:hypothetical protein